MAPRRRRRRLFLVCALLALAVATPAPARARAIPKARVVDYEVIAGDTLGGLASRFGASLPELRRLNPKTVGKGDRIRAGSVLHIPATRATRALRKAWVTVQKGDTLGAIALRVGVTARQLQKDNGVDPRRLRVGSELVYYKQGPEKDSRAVGYHTDGRLVDGELLLSGPGHTCKDPNETWGTNETVTVLLDCAAEYHRQFPKAPPLLIGDLSRPGGGAFPPHKSHHTGLDVDVGYVLKGVTEAPKAFARASAATLDVERTWAFARCLIRSGRVRMIFADAVVQRALLGALKAKRITIRGYTPAELFQVASTDPAVGRDALFRLEAGHDDHLHVRFACDPADDQCRDRSDRSDAP